jgi:CHAD domain-containing protein
MPLPLKDCYDSRVLIFQNQFALASEFASTDAIHEMRVSLKRLRAFFNLIESINPRFKAEKAYAPARKLFRTAGKVRNLHVLEAKVREASTASPPGLSEYYNWLKADEHQEIKKFERFGKRFPNDFFESAWISMAPLLAEPPASRIINGAEDRLLDLIKEIRKESSMRSDVRRLHFLRTRTKEARYTLEIIQECGLTGDKGAFFNDLLRDVHQSLGRWHDEEIVLKSLREFRKRRGPGPLVSFQSYLEFSRLTKARKAESLSDFEAAWMAFMKFLGRGSGRRILLRPSVQ